MPPRRIAGLLLAAAAAACAAGTAARRDAPDAPPATWKDAMHAVGDDWDAIDRALRSAPSTDLRPVAAAATHAAERVRLGYGAFERKDVPGFARLARDTESWLLELSLEARQGHGDLVRDLFRGSKARYCARCHDAVERAGK